MANNLFVKDANGTNREIKTLEAGGVHTPVQHAEGPLTNLELRAADVKVAGPVTDTQLRASPVPVVGPLTDVELRASSVQIKVDSAALPLPVTVSGLTVVGAESTLVPISSGIYSGGGTVHLIPLPPGAIGVRLYGANATYFNFDAQPGTKVNNTLSAGGAVYQSWREIRWVLGKFLNLQVMCPGSGDTIIVEFLKAGPV
jgi:hypothetical protein